MSPTPKCAISNLRRIGDDSEMLPDQNLRGDLLLLAFLYSGFALLVIVSTHAFLRNPLLVLYIAPTGETIRVS
jgi:hypothetical protein